jgi:hypothetical protein
MKNSTIINIEKVQEQEDKFQLVCYRGTSFEEGLTT